jgi:hypothetical protein
MKMKKGCKVNTVKRNNLKYENAMAIVQTFRKPHKPKSLPTLSKNHRFLET